MKLLILQFLFLVSSCKPFILPNNAGSYTLDIYKTQNNHTTLSVHVWEANALRQPLPLSQISIHGATVQTVQVNTQGEITKAIDAGRYKISVTSIYYKSLSTKYFRVSRGDSVVVGFHLADAAGAIN